MKQLLVQVEQFTISYTTRQGELRPVVRSVSLTIERGATLGLVGESGCGKSTLGMALLGYLRRGSQVSGGQVRIGDTNVFQLDHTALERLRGKRVAFVPQNASQALTPTMRIGAQATEALILHHGMHDHAARQRVLELFERMRLPDPEALLQRYPHELSGGQQQRVAIAMALARRPDLLILDEPTTGLDVTTQMHVLNLLRTLVQEHATTMLYISHDLEVIARVCHQVAVMYAGELVETGPMNRLFDHPAHPYTRGLLASLPRISQAGLPQAIPGQPPAPHEPRPACAFAPRCVFATGQCYEQVPPFTSVDTLRQHQVRCHHWQTVAEHMVTTPAERMLERGNISPEPLLTLQDVAIRYARPDLLQRIRRIPTAPSTVSDVSLRVQRGETLALVGESGSGKTTLLRAIGGLKTPHAGRIELGTTNLVLPVDQRPREIRRAIQIIFQNPDASLNPRQTVASILEQPLRLYFELEADQYRKRALALLEQVRLAPHYMGRFPGQLSGGEKQRVAIARAFAAEPDLVLCDEVTSALDVSVQAAVLEVLSDLQRQRNVTYLFITHNLAVVRAIADRVAVLYHGRLCEVSPATLLDTPPWHPYTETLLRAERTLDLTTLPDLLARDQPDPAPPLRGCPFQRRCPHHLGSVCNEVAPPWQESGNGQQFFCHLTPDELRLRQT